MSTLTLPTYDPRALAAALRNGGLPGQRSMTAIRNLRRDRSARTRVDRTPDLADRFTERLTARAVAEITRRGGETTIESQSSTYHLAIVDRDPAQRMTLLAVAGWRRYGQRHSWAALAYLCGVDDAGPWAVRVPGDTATVGDALAWITPAAVKEARAAGRRVSRQGDVYAIETTRAHDGNGDLPDAHTWDAGTRTLTHRPVDGRQHAPLTLDYPVRFVRQRVLDMGRSGRWTYGD